VDRKVEELSKEIEKFKIENNKLKLVNKEYED